MADRQKAANFSKEVLALFDGYVHGFIDRRAFLEGAAKVVGGGAAAVAVLDALQPQYAWAAQVEEEDERIRAEYVEYDSPDGSGTMRGYMAVPEGATGAKPAVLVIHENRGLNPYVEDVVRRFAAADFVALGPDALTPLGGYPGNDDDGRTMQRELDRDVMMEDWVAAFEFLRTQSTSNGRVGAVGFCYGGGESASGASAQPRCRRALLWCGSGVRECGADPGALAHPLRRTRRARQRRLA